MATTANFTMIGVAGRRLRVGQWHVQPVARGTSPRPALRPLVILSGIGMNMEMLEPIASRLPGRRIVSFDMPGIGQSPDPIFPYTIPHMALTLAALLDRLRIDSVDLLGISWGGAVVQQFAFQHRARTGKLVLAATSAGGTMIPGSSQLSGPSLLSQMFDPMQYSVEKTLRRNLAMFYNGGGADRVSLNAATAPSPLGWSCQMAAFAGWSSAPFLPLLSMPVMVMGDEDDQLIPPANLHFIHNAIPGSRLEMSDGGGHLFMLARPDAFIEKLTGFLDA